jgi:hypothetical protein
MKNLSLTILLSASYIFHCEGTDHFLCQDMVHIQGIDSFDDCAKECLLAEGGPLLGCSYLSFDDAGKCWLSPRCPGHHRPAERMLANPGPADATRRADSTGGVMQGELQQVCNSLFAPYQAVSSSCRFQTLVLIMCLVNACLSVYCSFEDSKGKACAGSAPIIYEGAAKSDLAECYDACGQDPSCRYFSFFPEFNGHCAGYGSCATFIETSVNTSLVYMMDGCRLALVSLVH